MKKNNIVPKVRDNTMKKYSTVPKLRGRTMKKNSTVPKVRDSTLKKNSTAPKVRDDTMKKQETIRNGFKLVFKIPEGYSAVLYYQYGNWGKDINIQEHLSGKWFNWYFI